MNEIHIRYSIVLFLCVCSNGCGKAPNLNVDAIRDEFGGKNPVGLLETSKKGPLGFFTRERGYCTAFVTDDGNVATNAHCIHDKDGKKLDAGDMRIFLRTPSQGETREYDIKQVVAYGYENEIDWAVLEPDGKQDIADTYGSLSFYSEVPDSEELKANLPVQVVKVNPPTESSNEAIVELRDASLLTSFDFTSAELELIKSVLPSDSSYPAKLKSKIEGEFSKPKQMIVRDSDVEPGNSGSPVLYQGKSIAIIYKEGGFSQWVPGLHLD